MPVKGNETYVKGNETYVKGNDYMYVYIYNTRPPPTINCTQIEFLMPAI